MKGFLPNNRWRHREVFFAHNGVGPYPCVFCAQPVSMDRVIVHHRDEDHGNNAPANLAAAHPGCHTSHHKVGQRHTEEARLRMAAGIDREKRRRVALEIWQRRRDAGYVSKRQRYAELQRTTLPMRRHKITASSGACAVCGDPLMWTRRGWRHATGPKPLLYIERQASA